MPSHFRKHLYTNELNTPSIRPIIKFFKTPKKMFTNVDKVVGSGIISHLE